MESSRLRFGSGPSPGRTSTAGGIFERELELVFAFLEAECKRLLRVLHLLQSWFLFNGYILLEGTLSCEPNQNLDVSDLWLDL